MQFDRRPIFNVLIGGQTLFGETTRLILYFILLIALTMHYIEV